MIELCKACNSSASEPYFNICRRCSGCGVVYKSPMPTLDELEKIYSECYSKESLFTDNTSMVSNNFALMQHAKLIARRFPITNKVLDFGAGIGSLVSHMREQGLNAVGFEPSAGARNEARHRYNIELLNDLAEQKESFSVVTAIEVVEHFPDPIVGISEIQKVLKPGGWAYITTPNIESFRGRVDGAEWAELKKPFHLYLFNRKSLVRLLHSVGFKKVEVLRFSPLTQPGLKAMVLHRTMQALSLYGGLRVFAQK